MKDLYPILKSLKKQKVAPILLALQVAITFMVLVNTAYMISERSKKMQRPTGLDEANTFYISAHLQSEGEQLIGEKNENLRQIRELDGVISATALNSMPLLGWGNYLDLYLDPKGESIAIGGYFGADEHALTALNLELIAGEWFTPTDIVPTTSDGTFIATQIVVTQTLAKRIYPDNWRAILGSTLYYNDSPHRVKGVVKTLQNAWQFWHSVDATVIAAVNDASSVSAHYYAIRTTSERLDDVMAKTVDLFLQKPGIKIEKVETMSQVRQRAYREDLSSNKILTAIALSLALITGLGIFGQARYNVSRRTKQIGTRRALGANKTDIVRYFMTENAIVCVTGVCIGWIGAVILNNQFVTLLTINPVPMHYLLAGTLMIIALGQLAVVYPATKASNVSPAIATRGA